MSEHITALARSIAARVNALAERGCADELRVLDYLLVRLELGEQQYGRLDLATDRRDWAEEERQEHADGVVYRACAEISRLGRGR